MVLLADVAQRDVRLRRAWDAIADSTVRVLSVDVFDTLLFRTVAQPVDAFLRIGHRLAQEGLLPAHVSADAFAAVRTEAERLARERRTVSGGDPEINLREIYDVMPQWLLRPEDRATAMDLEIEVEHSLLVPDLEVVELLLAAQDAGKRLIIVSDNYLGEQHLRRLLGQPLLGQLTFQPVYCSCDHRVGKADGLFRRVLADLAVDAGAIVHVGDNGIADHAAPSAFGIVTVPFPQRDASLSEISSREDRLRRVAGTRGAPDHGLAALRGKMAGFAAWSGDPSVDRYWRWGASVLGPVLSGFADWVCEEASARDLGQVHCLMREGLLLSDLVNAAATYGNAPETVAAAPLWLNRRVCLRATIGDDPVAAVERVYSSRTPMSLGATVRMLGLDLGDVPALADHAATRLNDDTIRTAFLGELNDPRIRAKVAASSRRLADRVVRVLEQAAGDRGHVVLVDLGWGASIQHLAQELLRSAGSDVRTIGFYLLTHRGAVKPMTMGAEVHGFLGDAGPPEVPTELFIRSPEILEQVCTAPLGSQTGLTEDLEPLLDQWDWPPLQTRQSRAVREGARAFQAAYGRYRSSMPDKVRGLQDAADALRPILVRATADPTGEEALLFGDWVHDEGRGSLQTDRIAGGEDESVATHASPEQLRNLPLQRIYWPYGLAARAGEPAAGLMSAAVAGLLPWSSTSTPLENGAFEVTALEGMGLDDLERETSPPRRNLAGRSLALASLRAPALHVLQVLVGYKPHVLRLDWLRISLWEQAADDVRTVDVAGPEALLDSGHPGYAALGGNVFVAAAHDARLIIDLRPHARRVVSAVDIEAGFAFMPIPAGTKGNADLAERLQHTEATLAAVQGSASWRVTAPLRRVKQLRSRIS